MQLAATNNTSGPCWDLSAGNKHGGVNEECAPDGVPTPQSHCRHNKARAEVQGPFGNPQLPVVALATGVELEGAIVEKDYAKTCSAPIRAPRRWYPEAGHFLEPQRSPAPLSCQILGYMHA